MSDEWWVMEIEWRKLSDQILLPKQALVFQVFKARVWWQTRAFKTRVLVLMWNNLFMWISSFLESSFVETDLKKKKNKKKKNKTKEEKPDSKEEEEQSTI